ncbi:DUF1329 domain-containing protein [Piscinibacter sp.]|uniref:DUF1329 domain-containing protein n=1 Tax=Piscinibacter sp. TaxID=1903157 RepID=UPI0039E71C7D
MFRKSPIALLLAGGLSAQVAIAAVTAEEAKQLGGDKLTAVGAERAGNKEGTIPPYSGKAPKAPAGYDPKDPGQRPSPYDDKPLFSITAQNVDQYADKLDHMRELFKRYPNYRMDVYPSHRDIEYPKYVLDNTIKNATSCKATQKELKLEGCYGGLPFPIPKTGNEVMWNHLLHFTTHTYRGATTSTLTPANGKSIVTGQNKVDQQYDYYNPANTKPNPTDLTFWKAFIITTAPARDAGNGILLLDNLDMVDKGRRAYQYIPGQRRVKLSPNLAYDTPNPLTGGTGTMDDAKGFLGALDRYDFKLIGKKEKFLPYNNFGVSNAKVCNQEKLTSHKNFPNPDCMRWELHRVWQVEATLKEGFRHAYQKRIFYWDEDAPGGGVVENFDAAGKLYRVVLANIFPFYDTELGSYADASMAMDLQTGSWISNGISPEPGMGMWPIPPKDDREFSPEALAGQGIR